MYIDAENRLSNAQAIAAVASTNIIDFSSDRNMGIGEPLCLVVVVTTLLDGTTGDETYSVTMQTDDNAGFGSPTTIGGVVALPRNSAVGTKFIITIPPDTAMERYFRVLYGVGGTTPLGAVTTFLTSMKMVQNDVHYDDAITVG